MLDIQRNLQTLRTIAFHKDLICQKTKYASTTVKQSIFQNEYDVWQFRIWLAELLKQKVELEKQIESAKKGERAEALKTVKKTLQRVWFYCRNTSRFFKPEKKLISYVKKNQN